MIFKLAIATPMIRPARRLASPGLALLALLWSGCGNSTLYELPPPPPEQERQDVSLIPGEDERARERDYLEARATVLKVYQYLNAKRYKEALSLLSEETVDFLSYVSPKKDTPQAAEETLAQGKVILNDGQVIPIDPAALLVARDISKLEDSLAGQKESETSRRKEIFAIQADGKAQRIIVIKEAGQWVIHKTSISTLPTTKR